MTTIAARLARAESIVLDGLAPPACPDPFHTAGTDYRRAAMPLSPDYTPTSRSHCPSCGRVQGGVTVEAVLVDLHLRPIAAVSVS